MRAALLDLPDGEGSFEDFCNNAGSAFMWAWQYHRNTANMESYP
jgi:hypothetical protein